MDISSLEGILVSRQSLAGNNDSRMRSLAAAECFSWCLMCTTTKQNHSAQGNLPATFDCAMAHGKNTSTESCQCSLG